MIRLKKHAVVYDPAQMIKVALKFRKPGLFFFIALVLAVMIARQSQTAYSFFQSPGGVGVSPVTEPPTNTPVPPPTDTPVSVQPTDAPTSVPVDTPTPVLEATVTPVEAAPVIEPTPTPEAAEPEAQALPNSAERPVAPIVQPVQAVPLVQLPAAEVSPAPGDPGVVLNEVKLIDTVTQWFAYIWLCMGVAVILTVPIFFLFMQMRGKQLNR
jgi:hypothetical protein